MTLIIRLFEAADSPALHAINIESEPGVGAVSEDGLANIIAAGTCLVATDAENTPVGFLLTLGPDANYTSKNYQWFDERFEDFIYVDRIAVSQSARGNSIGTKLYEHALATFAGKALLIGCEVNATPPNPGSMRFHKQMGFTEIGAQVFAADYAVTYLARRLSA